jgi:hypothetical protein
MHFIYGFCDGNSLAALREYEHQYLDCRQPCIFRRVLYNLRETGTVMPHACASCGRHSVWDEEDVLDIT